VHVDITSEGWEHAIPQGYGITEFIAQVETGTFTITWLQILLRTRYIHCLLAINPRVGSGTHGDQTAAVITGVEREFIASRPVLLAVYGDVNSTLREGGAGGS
jgi:hypothetical protein